MKRFHRIPLPISPTRAFAILSIAALAALSTLAAASAPGYDLLRYVPANDYPVAASIQPAKVFAAPLVADRLADGGARRILAGLQELKNRTGIDAKTDIDAVVVAGKPSAEPDKERDGVVIVRGRWDKAKLLEALAKAPEYAEKTVAGKPLYTFFTPRDNRDKALAFLGDTTLALGSEEAVSAALTHGGALAGSLAADETFQSLSRSVPDDATGWILVRSPRDVARFPRFRPVVANLNQFAAWAVATDTLSVEAKLVADSPEHARDMAAAAQGFLALGRLQLDNAAAEGRPVIDVLKPVIDKVRCAVDDQTLTVSAEFTVEELQAIRQARSRIREELSKALPPALGRMARRGGVANREGAESPTR